MMLSPYSAKAIALQILFRCIRCGPLARRHIRRRYFFNDRRWSHVAGSHSFLLHFWSLPCLLHSPIPRWLPGIFCYRATGCLSYYLVRISLGLWPINRRKCRPTRLLALGRFYRGDAGWIVQGSRNCNVWLGGIRLVGDLGKGREGYRGLPTNFLDYWFATFNSPSIILFFCVQVKSFRK